ncbi:hypothetical protein [Salisediminibacterium beveridgei]|uniref:hypothetical protein n=1 Tax=Salisediminibacterium beveridgei TaxID=632773 RepID=UPI0012EEE082|nr:hypothetical protein [Salisediminibacterium beveridgei]
MKKLLTALAFVAFLSAGTGVAGATDVEPVKEVTISAADDSFGTLSKPIVMD